MRRRADRISIVVSSRSVLVSNGGTERAFTAVDGLCSEAIAFPGMKPVVMSVNKYSTYCRAM